MYQFNNLTSNVPNVQIFNGNNASVDTKFYSLFFAGTVPGTGQANQITTTSVNYYKTDFYGSTAFPPQVNDRFTFGDGFVNGWVNATITAVTDNSTYWSVTVDTPFAGTLTGGGTYALNTLRPSVYPWQSWTKPNDAVLIHILCIGGGGGGGSGRKSNLAQTIRIGGSGGGAAAVTSMYVPAFLIPDTLYVQVGLGGVGGSPQTAIQTNGRAGVAGGTSYVALYPSYLRTSFVGNLLLSANGGAGGTAGGNGVGSSAAGGAALTVGASSPFYLGLGQFTSTTGQTSSASYFQTPAALNISGITCAGAAGGGVSGLTDTAFAGGAINSPSALIPYLTSLAGGAINNNGNDGYAVKKPLMWIGGTGGGSQVAGNGGIGGKGAIGSGGGGGGATSSGNSGAGGNGGNGIVIITSYSI